MKLRLLVAVCVLFFSVGANTAQGAGIPVVDSANLSQNAANFAKEIKNMADQLQTAKQHVEEQIKQFESLTGSRGLETLLDGTVRNYIPASWNDAMDILSKPTGYGDIAGKASEILQAHFNDPEVNKELERLPAKDRQRVEQQREHLAKSAAMMEAIYEEAEERTEAINFLTEKIGDAEDPKAMQELQAMIDAEQGHLQIALNKMNSFFQRLQVESALEEQKIQEEIINSAGSIKTKRWKK